MEREAYAVVPAVEVLLKNERTELTTTQEKTIVIEADVCYRHPNRTTRLRCNRCLAYICVQCARRSAVGYKCPACMHKMQNTFFNGRWWDYGIAVLLTLPLSLLAAFIFTYLIGRIGWFSWYITFLAAPITAGFIAEVVRWGVGRRRSRYLARVVVGCFITATVSMALFLLITGGWWADLLGALSILVESGILLVVGTGMIMARLR